jgi:hypothetical protein
MSAKKKQDLLYTFIGVTIMVPIMSLYNKFIIFKNFMEYPLSSPAFWKAVGIGICQRYPVVFLLQFFVVQNVAEKQTARHTKPDDDWIYVSIIRTGFSILILCPVLSLYAHLLLILDGTITTFSAFMDSWLQKLVINWPFAYMVQVFIAGPLNRAIFLAIMRSSKKRSMAKK